LETDHAEPAGVSDVSGHLPVTGASTALAAADHEVPDVAEESDEALMQAFALGDAGAFDRLYARHRGALFRFLQRQCGQRALAEELFQDVWTALIGARERYRTEARFTTYLYTLARHRLIDHYRRQGVRAQVDVHADEESLENAPHPDPGPAAQLQASRRLHRLVDLVEALPSAQREVILLRAEADLTLEEMATITSAERETVKSRLRYALDKLRRGMEGYL